MRRILPIAIIGIVALAGCASAGEPEESAPAPDSQTPVPTVTETVTPEPTQTSEPSPTAEAEAPYRLEDDALAAYSIDDIPGGEPLVVWADADRTLVHVLGTGSGSLNCQPAGESIEVDDGMLEIDFEWEESDPMMACTADLRVFGWAFPVVGADDTITEAHVDDWTQDGQDFTVEIQPMSETN
ncbi:hypothetical protein SAMN04487783_0360 [Agrococcus baldri]|uniref:Lipoprotein n=1 Tax=Agrococcus baldri TaxID=153730 RepID=A0AA94HKD8_9MICO|nr:hypothetical protein [Agrococcus baldri]SFR99542.1 hypothetical protein SAMN04487783_0360 [Agrococcus baldri]